MLSVLTNHRSIRRRRFFWICLLSISTFGVAFRRPLFFSNFGVVSEGRVYRSAQPTHDFVNWICEKRLESVLDLRGGSMADSWYAQEVTDARINGVDFYDFPMSATTRPSRQEILTLLTFFEQCRYPLLIHCKSGSDRTGLASALYLMAIENVGPQKARGALTLSHGHVPILGTKHLHEPLDEYQQWLSSRHLAHSSSRFRDWIENQYKSGGDRNLVRPLLPGPRVQVADRPDLTRTK